MFNFSFPFRIVGAKRRLAPPLVRHINPRGHASWKCRAYARTIAVSPARRNLRFRRFTLPFYIEENTAWPTRDDARNASYQQAPIQAVFQRTWTAFFSMKTTWSSFLSEKLFVVPNFQNLVLQKEGGAKMANYSCTRYRGAKIQEAANLWAWVSLNSGGDTIHQISVSPCGSVQAVGSIVWACRRLKKPRTQDRAAAATRFIAYASNVSFFLVMIQAVGGVHSTGAPNVRLPVVNTN